MDKRNDSELSAPTAERPDKRILLSLADGPESIEIYESEEQAVVDWAAQIPALYVNASIGGATVRLGPFHLLKWPAQHTAPSAAPATDAEQIAEHDRDFPPRGPNETAHAFLLRILLEHRGSHAAWIGHSGLLLGGDAYQKRAVERYDQAICALNELTMPSAVSLAPTAECGCPTTSDGLSPNAWVEHREGCPAAEPAAPSGRCCDNGTFDTPHDCQKGCAAPSAVPDSGALAQQWMFNVADQIVWLVRGYADNIVQQHHKAVGQAVDLIAAALRPPAAPSAAPDSGAASDWIVGNGEFQEAFRRDHLEWSVETIRAACEVAEAYAAPLQARVLELEAERDKAREYSAELQQQMDPLIRKELEDYRPSRMELENWSFQHFDFLDPSEKQALKIMCDTAKRAESAEAERHRLKAALRVTGFTYHLAHANPGITVSTVEDCPFCKSWVSALDGPDKKENP